MPTPPERVKETSTTTGTGTLNLDGAVSKFRSFVAGVGTGNQCYYSIVHQSSAEWEVGIGTVTDATPDTLSRTTVLASSNAGALVNFSAGTKDVFVTIPGSKIALLNDANTFTANQTISNTAPSLVLTDTTASAKSLTIVVDANFVDLRESAGASGSLLTLDLANGRVGIGTATPGAPLAFSSAAGDKIRTYDDATYIDGFGSNAGLQIFGNDANKLIAFGSKTRAGVFTEMMRISSGNVGIGMTPTYQLQLSTDSAAKPTTNTWTIASDANMKDASKQRPYERGLDLIRALPTPHYWTYNGKADTPEGVESMGWNAQDLEVIAPKMVRRTRGKLTPAREKRVNKKGQVELVPVPKEIVDALPETDLLGVNTHELTYAMFNAVRELDSRVEALEKKP